MLPQNWYTACSNFRRKVAWKPLNCKKTFLHTSATKATDNFYLVRKFVTCLFGGFQSYIRQEISKSEKTKNKKQNRTKLFHFFRERKLTRVMDSADSNFEQFSTRDSYVFHYGTVLYCSGGKRNEARFQRERGFLTPSNWVLNEPLAYTTVCIMYMRALIFPAHWRGPMRLGAFIHSVTVVSGVELS